MKQIVIIKQIDYSEDIATLQKKLTVTYLAYPIIACKVLGNFDTLQLSSTWWTAQIIFHLLLLPVWFWLYRRVSYKNINKKWVKYIIGKSAKRHGFKAHEVLKIN